LKAANKQLTEWDAELNQLHIRNGDLGLKVQMLEQELKEARRDRTEIQKSVTASREFPEPADLLNQLKGRRKKSRADLGDIEAILGLLAEEDGSD
jgi:chromosome segregation ATPase